MCRAFLLPVSHVIHTVGPIYGKHDQPEVLLANAYRSVSSILSLVIFFFMYRKVKTRNWSLHCTCTQMLIFANKHEKVLCQSFNYMQIFTLIISSHVIDRIDGMVVCLSNGLLLLQFLIYSRCHGRIKLNIFVQFKGQVNIFMLFKNQSDTFFEFMDNNKHLDIVQGPIISFNHL